MKLYRIKQEFSDHGSLDKESKTRLHYMRIQPIDKSKQDSQGGQFFADWKIFLPANTKIEEKDRVELDDRVYTIKQMYRVRNILNKIHHIEVWI